LAQREDLAGSMPGELLAREREAMAALTWVDELLARRREALAALTADDLLARQRETMAALTRLEELLAREREAMAAPTRPHKALARLRVTFARLRAYVKRAWARAREELARKRANTADNMPITIYLADEGIHEQVETAVEQWLATADVSIDTRAKPVIGSWFRRMEGSLKRAAMSPAAREAFLTAKHVADSHLIQAQDAHVTATLLQGVAPVLQALQQTKDAVVRAGAVLIVKVDWVVQVHQLTAAQQAILDHRPHLAASPQEIITALESPGPVSQEAALQPAAPQLGTGPASN
jgi:hypothetical protein